MGPRGVGVKSDLVSCLVEWGDRADPPSGAIRVDLELEADGSRRIAIHGLELEATT